MTKFLSALLSCLLSFLPYGILRPEPVENAYMLVFKEFVENKKYVALDLDVSLSDASNLEKAIEAYCDENGITLLPYDFAWLVDEGYIEMEYSGGMVEYFWWFNDGLLIALSGKDLTKRTLEISIDLRSDVMIGTTYNYEATRIFGKWRVLERERLTVIV